MPDSPSEPADEDDADADDPSSTPATRTDPADAGERDADSETGRAEAGRGPSAPADSRWWYWVAAVPLYFVLATVVGFAVGVVAFAMALTGAATMGPGMGPSLGVGFGFFGVFAVVMLLATVGLLLTLLFPVAIYLDADAVAETPGEWEPDPVLYGLLGLAGVVAQPLQAPLAVYYLYKRHDSEGVP